MNCAACGRPVDREHSYLRLERGVVIDGRTIPADRNFCRPACLATWLEGAAS